MSIVLKEKGLPIEIALRHTVLKKLLPEERILALKNELCSLTEEVTVKFIGFFASKSVKDGLDLTLHLLSFGLEHETNGAYDPDIWVKQMDRLGLKGLIKKVLVLFKELMELPELEEIVVPEINREGLIKKAIIVWYEGIKRNKTTGYYWYQSDYVSRVNNVRMLELLSYLMSTTKYKSLSLWKDTLDEIELQEQSYASNIVNSFLLRVSLGLRPSPSITYKELLVAYSNLKKGGKSWIVKSEARYRVYLKKIPEKFREMEYMQSWFKVNFRGAFVSSHTTPHGLQYFNIVHVPEKVMARMIEEGNPYKKIPKDKRAIVSP